MTMTGDKKTDADALIHCPSCGEAYGSWEGINAVLRNAGFCVNLTCLADLSREPLDEALARVARPERRDVGRRDSDRRAV